MMKTKVFFLVLTVIFLFTTYDAEARRIRCCKRIKKEIKRTEERIHREIGRQDPVLQKVLGVTIENLSGHWMQLRDWMDEENFNKIHHCCPNVNLKKWHNLL